MPQSLVKTVRFDISTGLDYWPSFLAGVTKTPEDTIETNPLAFLHLRKGARPATTTSTMGMIPVPGTPDEFTWERRKFKKNPNEAERPYRPVVHETPMYAPEVKKNFSKPQSTTGIWPEHGVMPALFGHTRARVGVILPVHPDCCLINLLLGSDLGTIDRPFDASGWETGRTLRTSLADLLLNSSKGMYNEVVARLKWTFNPETTLSLPHPPAILVHADPDPKIFLTAVLLGMIRGFDLTLAIHRKFGNFDYSAPLMVYTPGRGELGEFYDLNVDPELFIRRIICCFNPATLRHEQHEMFLLIKLQQALVGLNRGKGLGVGWDMFLRTPPPRTRAPILYPETLRVLVKCCFGSRDAHLMHPGYKALFEGILEGDREKNIQVYGFQAECRSDDLRQMRIRECRDPIALSYLVKHSLLDETIIKAVGAGSIAVVTSALERGVDLNNVKSPQGHSLFVFAIYKIMDKDIRNEMIKFLLRVGLKPSYNDLFHVAVRSNDCEVLEFFSAALGRNRDLAHLKDFDGASLFKPVVIIREEDVRDKMIKFLSHVGVTPVDADLCNTVASGDPRLLMFFLSTNPGLNLHVKDLEGDSLLKIVARIRCKDKRAEMIKFLISRGLKFVAADLRWSLDPIYYPIINAHCSIDFDLLGFVLSQIPGLTFQSEIFSGRRLLTQVLRNSNTIVRDKVIKCLVDAGLRFTEADLLEIILVADPHLLETVLSYATDLSVSLKGDFGTRLLKDVSKITDRNKKFQMTKCLIRLGAKPGLFARFSFGRG